MTRDDRIFAKAIKRIQNLSEKEKEEIRKQFYSDTTNYDPPEGMELLYPPIEYAETNTMNKGNTRAAINKKDEEANVVFRSDNGIVA